MKRLKDISLAAMLGAALLAPGSAFANTTNEQQSAATVQDASGQYDQQIANEVRDKLKKDKFKNVAVSAKDGVVTLTGSVELYAQKLDAAKRASGVRNIQSVNNAIAVSSEAEDAELTQDLARKLAYDRVFNGQIFNALTVDVQDGVATIGGHVRDYADRSSALSIAQNMKGVKRVVDQVQVAPASIHDDRLRIALANALYGYGPLGQYAVGSNAPVRIVVERGNVTLEGVVNSQVEKQLAGNVANSTFGVFSVKNNLVVGRETARK